MTTTYLIIEYNGYNIYGVTKQKDYVTIHSILEKYIEESLQQKVQLYFMSRTDAGVSAYKQICKVEYDNSTLEINIALINHKFRKNNEPIFIHDIKAIKDIKKISKTYIYKIGLMKNSPILEKTHYLKVVDIDVLKKLCSYLNNKVIDYSSFCYRSKENIRETVMSLKYKVQKVNKYELYIYITGKFFLYKQIRNIVGTVVKLSQPRYKDKYIEKLQEIIESKSRTKAYTTAPSNGLYLYEYHTE